MVLGGVSVDGDSLRDHRLDEASQVVGSVEGSSDEHDSSVPVVGHHDEGRLGSPLGLLRIDWREGMMMTV